MYAGAHTCIYSIYVKLFSLQYIQNVNSTNKQKKKKCSSHGTLKDANLYSNNYHLLNHTKLNQNTIFTGLGTINGRE